MKTFKSAKTDSGNEIRFSDDPERAGVNNLLTIYQAVTGKSKKEVEKDFETARGYGDLKIRTGEAVIEALKPVQERYHQIAADRSELDRMLKIGNEKAAEISSKKLAVMQERMGLL